LAAVLKRLWRIILVVVTLSTGVVVLFSFVLDDPTLHSLRGLFVEWTVIVTAFAMLLGVFNVVRVHAQRIQSRKGALYSIVLVVSFLAIFVPGILSAEQLPGALGELAGEYVGPTGSIVGWIYQYVQRPLQATLFSLMAFFVFTAAWRVFRVRGVVSVVMLLAALVVLLGSVKLSLGGNWSQLVDAKSWVMNVPVMAGARGMLLGIALGTIITGLRLLLGVDRPYID
jgi:hypothetical protein